MTTTVRTIVSKFTPRPVAVTHAIAKNYLLARPLEAITEVGRAPVRGDQSPFHVEKNDASTAVKNLNSPVQHKTTQSSTTTRPNSDTSITILRLSLAVASIAFFLYALKKESE